MERNLLHVYPAIIATGQGGRQVRAMHKGRGSARRFRWVLAGAMLALGTHEGLAQNANNAVLPAWAVFPSRMTWPEDPRFSTQGLWPDDPRYKTPLNSTYTAQPFVSLFDQDHQFVSKSSTTSSSGLLNFAADYEFRDSTKTDGKSFLGFFTGNNSKWQENQVGYTNLKTNFGESIRVSTRFGASSYDASQEFFNSLSEKKSQEETRAARFASVGFASGTAAHTRVEEDVLRFGDAKITLSQEFARVDPYFEDIKFSDKGLRRQTKDDIFSKPDRDTAKYGISFVQGSSGLSVSQSSISNISEGPNSFYREQRYDSKAWLGLREMYTLGSDSFMGNFVPTSVWVGYGGGSVKRNEPDSPGAAVTNMDAGALWQWGNISTSVSGWRSLEAGPQQISATPVRSFSDGADVSITVSKQKWKLTGYVSLTRSTYEDMWSSSSSNSVSGGAYLSLLFEQLPNVTLALDVNNYADYYSYVASNGGDGGRFSTAGIAFDFSKYLTKPDKQKLQLFYYARKEGFDSRWGALLSQNNQPTDHVFGASMRTRW